MVSLSSFAIWAYLTAIAAVSSEVSSSGGDEPVESSKGVPVNPKFPSPSLVVCASKTLERCSVVGVQTVWRDTTECALSRAVDEGGARGKLEARKFLEYLSSELEAGW